RRGAERRADSAHGPYLRSPRHGGRLPDPAEGGPAVVRPPGAVAVGEEGAPARLRRRDRLIHLSPRRAVPGPPRAGVVRAEEHLTKETHTCLGSHSASGCSRRFRSTGTTRTPAGGG